MGWGLAVAPRIVDGDVVTSSREWVPGLGLTIDVFVDGFGLLMVLLISAVGALVLAYTRWYLGRDPKTGAFAGLIVAFAGAMLGIVVADNLIFLFVFWELTSMASFLLIGFRDEEAAARSAALQALLVTGAGGLALLAGFVLLAIEADTFSLRQILAHPPSSTTAAVAVCLVLVGAFTKSAQVPFHFWLPGAMAAPTPVSAYLHSATMVKAGVYLVARMSPAFAGVFGFWIPLVVGVGIATMVVGGLRALYQTDLKLLLALGTVSQLGFLVALLGTGAPEIAFAGVTLLLAHAVFKAALFMVVGIVDHQAHTRDLRKLTGIGRVMKSTAIVAVVGVASMVGIPLTFGFVAKEAALESVLDWSHLLADWATLGVVVGSSLTAAYGARFLWGGFVAKRDEDLLATRVDPASVPPPAVGFLVPAAILAAATVLWGVAPVFVDGLVGAAAESLAVGAGEFHLAAWHGLGTPLLLSAATLVAGLGAHSAVRRAVGAAVASAIARGRATPTVLYTRSLHLLNRVADRTTAIVQPGSLPFYAGVILSTVLVVPSIWLLRAATTPDRLVTAESPIQVVATTGIVVGALGAATAARRIGAVIFLGAVGYSVSLVFVIQGAPDLALTQVLIETLTLAIFTLVLRLLPVRFEPARFPIQRVSQVVIAGALGIFVAGFALLAGSARVAEPVSGELIERALTEGGGKNVVNVILTDFRAFDTLGEISVLAVAALGIVALALAGRHTGELSDEEAR